MFGQFCNKKQARTKLQQQPMTPSTVIVALSGSFVRIQSCQINGGIARRERLHKRKEDKYT